MKKITLAEGTVLEITDEAYQALLDANKKGRWRAENGSRYYFVIWRGVSVNIESGNKFDEFIYLTRNYFQTREEAKAHLARINAIARVSDAIDERNGGWVPDWGNDDKKFDICFDREEKEFDSDYTDGDYQFISILPYIKSEEIAESIIRDFEGDLKVIFNV
jgi:hypothetical protein